MADAASTADSARRAHGAGASAIRTRLGSLSGRELAALGGMGGVVVLLHVVGWGVLLAVVATQDQAVGSAAASSTAFGVGLGLTAYTLGLRHAFDADHIAAIDNTTRKLMGDGQRPLSVGFWFSLGHSSVVFCLCLLLAGGVRSVLGQPVAGDAVASSPLGEVLGGVGTSVSGVFLCVIGILNLGLLVGIVRVFRRMRHGELDEAALEEQLNDRGLLNRIYGGVTRVVRRPWHMYPIGLLFGLGFDTATEVSLLVLAGGAAVFALPWYAVLALPILFAAGMSLLDSIDGCFMNFAYGWAFSRPVRKVYYNLVVTALSVAVALVVGSAELLSFVVDRVGITTGPLAVFGALDLGALGYTIVAMFVLVWLMAVGAWRFGHVEEKWSAALSPGATEVGG